MLFGKVMIVQRQIRTPNRKKRCCFFFLTTNTEVPNKVNNALQLLEAYAEQSKLKIDIIDSLLEDTDMNLSEQE